MIIIKVSNQRSYFYIRVSSLSNLGYVWQKLSEKGYFKFHNYYDLDNQSEMDFLDSFRKSDTYFDSIEEFLKK